MEGTFKTCSLFFQQFNIFLMYLETFQPGPNVTVASKLAARNNIYNAHIERLN